jgi:8-oxo-dGTP diphosphatase
MNEKRPRVGVGVIVWKNGQVLLGQRKGSHGAGKWGFVGGHLEFGETIETCASRELMEETGIKALSFQLGPWTSDLIDEDKHYVTLFVLVDQFEGEPRALEPHRCEKWEWFDWNALPSPLFTPIESLLLKFELGQMATQLVT